MIKSEIVRGLKDHAKGSDWISQKEIRAYLGVNDKQKSRKLVQGTAHIGRRYYIPDVAAKLMGQVRR
ncbi:MAG: hypothetical protein PUC26_05870 [Eubacteriales bacterium]|nr:hypothetical protein [Eubacteriales bacterium]